jgi:hypothetical protein
LQKLSLSTLATRYKFNTRMPIIKSQTGFVVTEGSGNLICLLS